MPQYHYSQPSLDSGSIRLLRLLPNEDEAHPIECKLCHYPLQKSHNGTHLYEALSYVWGGSDKPQSVFIDECNLPITANLHSALSRLRDRYFERIIWADSICINQADEREKGRQIQTMAEIYGQANRVIVYLGEAADDSDQALEAICIAAESESTDSPISEKIQEAILKLLKRPWFRRIWVLQEVAAARRILIMCGSAEVDGYIFCSGINKLEHSYSAQPDLQSLIRSVTYLIRGAIFRLKYVMNPSSGLSLGELIDMYHTHEATERHDKVFALLGMSSDDPSAAGLSPNYTTPWRTLLQRLVEFILSREVSVETWDEREIAVIASEIYIFGQVSSVKSDSDRSDRQHVKVVSNNDPKSLGSGEEYVIQWTLQASAKSIRQHDFVCLLKGTSKPAIIRRCKDHFAIIMIAVTLRRPVQIESGHFKPQEIFASTKKFTGDFLLVWNWETSLENLQNRARQESSVEINTLVPGYLETDSNKAARSCDVALVLGDLEEWEKTENRLQEAIKNRERACGKENLQTLASIDSFAMIYMDRGQWKKAEDLLLQVIQTRKRVQGIDHQDTQSSIANLASTYIDQGDINRVILTRLDEEMILSLKDRLRNNVLMTEEELSYVVKTSTQRLIKLLLDIKKDNVQVGEKVVKAAATNKNRSKEIMTLLLDQCGNKVKITEEVLKAVAENQFEGKKVMALLLDRRGDEIEITEEVVRAAAENQFEGKKVMALLLDRRGDEIEITEEVVRAAAENQFDGKRVMTLLLDRRGDEVKITEEVLKAVAGNQFEGKKVMAMLLDRRGDEIEITEEVLKAVAGNEYSGAWIMALLLDQCSDRVNITEGVVKAAAKNWNHGKEILGLLLDQRGDEVKITQELLEAAAGNKFNSKEMIELLLDSCDELEITEKVAQIAAESWYDGEESWAQLVSQRRDRISSRVQ